MSQRHQPMKSAPVGPPAQLRMAPGGSVYECDVDGEILRLADINDLPDLPWGDDLADDEIGD